MCHQLNSFYLRRRRCPRRFARRPRRFARRFARPCPRCPRLRRLRRLAHTRTSCSRSCLQKLVASGSTHHRGRKSFLDTQLTVPHPPHSVHPAQRPQHSARCPSGSIAFRQLG